MSEIIAFEALGLQSMRIRRFKRINDAAIDLAAVNVFVGGNNAGKSSLIRVCISASACCRVSLCRVYGRLIRA